jgi:hypothetical protein
MGVIPDFALTARAIPGFQKGGKTTGPKAWAERVESAMDYGYQLLRHVLQQVFGNLKEAAQLTLFLFLLPFAGFIALGLNQFTTGAPVNPEVVGGAVGGALLILVLGVFCYCWAAVGWHRYVLLEETGNGFLPEFRGSNIVSYFGRILLVGLVLIAVLIAAMIVIVAVAAAVQSQFILLLFGIGLVFGVSWMATRIGLILPAAALGERMTIGESWVATRPVSSQILLPLIVIALAAGLINQAILLVLGQSVSVPDMFGVMQEMRVLTLPGQIVSGVVSWLQVLVNLALMTTLYGNLIEGRQLN